MANVVVTSDANTIKVDFGIYYPTYCPVSIAYYNRNEVNKVELYSTVVSVHVLSGTKDWELSFDGSAGFHVDTIDGVAPTDNSDLCDKVAALIKA